MSVIKSEGLKFMVDPSIAGTVRDVLLGRGWTEVNKEANDARWNVYWCEVGVARDALDMCNHVGHQRVPHFRNSSELTAKHMLFRHMRRYRRALIQSGKTKEAELCNSLPIVFELPGEYLMFVEEYRKSPGTTWIVKPARGSKGKGIFLFQKLKDLIEWREQQRAQCEEQDKFWLIQRYIEKPYLIGGCKFDLRIFVLVTSFQPLRAWMARDGFARIAGSQYSLSCLQDNLVHLTNSALQISASGDPGRQGCKWSLHKLRYFLTARHGAAVVSALFDQVARQVVSSLQSVQSSMMQDHHSFELYGYDVLLDEKLKPWLLEVNASPTLVPTSMEDYQLKHNLIEDVFNVLDLEDRLTGNELRVGGFDLMWKDGPVYKPFLHKIATGYDTELNSFLGCLNDRDENLKDLQILKAFVSRCTHT